MSVDDLISSGGLVAPEAGFDWAAARQVLAAEIPADFRRLVDSGGSGEWFGYIRVFAPDPRLTSQNLLDSGGVYRDLLVFWEDDPETRPPDLPDDSRLIAWANTSDGETLFWRVDHGVESTMFPIYIEDADGERWERFDMTTSDFLLGILRGAVRSSFFSETFLRVDQVFRPYPG